jgi:ABC-2 type transport system ATP-binding protein
MVNGPALEAHGVSKRFGDRRALCDVDLVAEPGRLHGLLGPNGAGKTTLMRVVLGLVRPDAGSVRILGRDVRSTAGPIPRGVAGCIDAPGFYPYLSGRTNLALLARLDDVDATGREKRVDEVLDQVGLRAHANAAVGGYSAGMRQRLALAAAFLRQPRLLVLDEPTSSLDPAGARDVRALARRTANEGTAVVLSSHDMAEVEELCSALTVINHGRVVYSGTVADLRRRSPACVHALRTSDDRAALCVASDHARVSVASAERGGLEVSSDIESLDAYVLALGRAGVAVRELSRRARTLESLFLDLTQPEDTGHAHPRPVRDAVEAPPPSLVAS